MKFISFQRVRVASDNISKCKERIRTRKPSNKSILPKFGIRSLISCFPPKPPSVRKFKILGVSENPRSMDEEYDPLSHLSTALSLLPRTLAGIGFLLPVGLSEADQMKAFFGHMHGVLVLFT
jgi:hypothetical protein